MKLNLKKARWVYNPHKLKFELVKFSFRKRFFQIVGFLSSSVVIGVILFFAFHAWVPSPNERSLKRELAFYEDQLSDMGKKVEQITGSIAELQDKDDNVYRTIFEADPIPSTQREGGSGGADKYRGLLGFSQSVAVVDLAKRIDKLTNQTKVQKQSFDALLALANRKADMLSCIPAVQPIANRDLRMIASGFGYRLDPIYKTTKMHAGIDFTAPMGKEIHATGNGVVSHSGIGPDGYGIKVVINHGYGYQTLYGHMMRVAVRPGQKIQRGDVIGYVGSTGKSTGPHVHYEVIKGGQKINPINYFYNDISSADYEKMVAIAERNGQSFD